MILPPDFKELLEEFARAGVEAVLVGGYAVAFHGRPRATKDIDLVLRHSDENLRRASEALARFGAPPNVAALVRTMGPADIVFLGQPPLRVDLLLAIDGVPQDELFARSIEAQFDGVGLRVISRDDLIANKRAAGRAQDILDAEFLERARRATEPPA